jgi:uncharacterized membrane protein YbhN (UPF0104 family)
MSDPRPLTRSPLFRAALGLGALALTALTFRDTSFEAALARIDLGAAIVALPALQGLGFALEALGWGGILRALGERPSFRALVRVRIMSEAIAQSIPLGVLVAEGSKPMLLQSHVGTSVPVGTASVAGRKVSLVATQALLLALVALFGAGPLGRMAPGSGPLLRGVVAACALVLASSAALSGRAFACGAVADKVRRALAHVPIVGPRVTRRAAAFRATDAAAEQWFGRPLRERARCALPFLFAWCVESLETFCLLRLVGVAIDPWTALCLEVPIGLLRSIAFFAPAGLGVQDLGYATALAAFGVPDAGAAALAFTLLKRCKEAFWIAVGWGLLVRGTTRRGTTTVAQPTGT